MDMNKRFSSFVAWKQLDRREDKGIRERGIRCQSIRFNQKEECGRGIRGVDWKFTRSMAIGAGYESDMKAV